ncbi:hypothetical protein Q7P35_008272 [Cladosporium inversicolor]
MVSYVKNYIQDQAMGYLATGITAAGTMAGNAVGGVGGLIESGGRSIGQGTTGITGAINGYGGKLENYGDGIKSKFAADGYVGASASQKAKREPSEAAKPYGLKRLPDASAPGNYVTNASRKILPKSMQPAPSAPATKQVRAQGSKPVGAPKTGQKALPAPTPKTAPRPATSYTKKPVTGGSPAPTKKPIPAVTGAAKPPAARGIATTPKPAPAGVNANKPSVTSGKTKISAASKPKPTMKPTVKPVLK